MNYRYDNRVKHILKLHDKLKNNKFRENYEVYSKYGQGYFDIFYEFADAFYELCESGDYPQLSKILETTKWYMHDFCSEITHARSCLFYIDNIFSKLPDETEEEYDEACNNAKKRLYYHVYNLEDYLMNIHSFCDTGYYDSFLAWEFGCHCQFQYNPTMNYYEIVKILKEQTPKKSKEYLIKNTTCNINLRIASGNSRLLQ